MEWIELCVKVPTEHTETAAAIATMTVPYGIYIEDYSDMEEMLPKIGRVDYIDEELIAKDRAHSIIHIYIPQNLAPMEALSFIEERLRAQGIEYETDAVSVREEDWANNWKAFYHPERVGNRLVVCPSWELYSPQEGDAVLTMDPGSSFGSGKHETTRLCLEETERAVKAGDAVLDMGCGSGILSIAALKLGAARAVAVDVDKNAAATAARNAQENGFEPPVYQTLAGNATEDEALYARIGGDYDLILANIVADVILAMRGLFWEKLKQGGSLIVSGIIDTRANEVLDALCAQGFVPASRSELRGWVAARFTRP